jgi:hypothetical protein
VGLPDRSQPFVIGVVESAVGAVPQVTAVLRATDQWGTFKARWGVGRMRYKVEPGLYALGRPVASSPVLVTANYKMSFDHLRRQLPARDAWLLVLDTDGVNVWCAAGKGTFGTAELIGRLRANGLAKVVSHRELIVPQLGAPGIAAHEVKKETGFTVTYGPVQAGDLPAYLDAGGRATPEMRRRRFPLRERLALIPVELAGALKWLLVAMPLLLLLGGLGGPDDYWSNARQHGLFAGLVYLSGLLAGTVLMPLLLPVLPGRAFACKGLFAGLLMALPVFGWRLWGWSSPAVFWELIPLLLIMGAVSSYYGMNFTGSSTYTSLSGVRKEMRLAVPLQIGAGLTGLALWVGWRFLGWG